MMAEADSAAIYQRVLDELASGDQVHPVEEMKGGTTTLIEQLSELEVDKVAEDSKQTLGPVLERFLAVALPLIVHGCEAGRRTVIGSLQAIANETGTSKGREHEVVFKIALHHLELLILAYALAHDRTDLLVGLTSVSVPNPYDRGQTPIFELADMRHADIFKSNAGDTFESARDIFASGTLRGEIPYLRRDEDLDAALGEAELVSALCLAQGNEDDRRPTYCHIIGADGTPERRLRGRVIGGSAGDIAMIFSVEPSKLPFTLNDIYRYLASAGPLAGSRGPLIPGVEEPR